MKKGKQRQAKSQRASIQQSINDNPTGGKKSLKNSIERSHRLTDRKEALSTSPGMSSEYNECNPNKFACARRFNNMATVIEQGEKQIPKPVAKMKLQLFPLDEEIRKGLETDGHNPFLELTLRPRKKVSSIINHLCNKWGSSSVAKGELMLFPFNAVVDNLTNSGRWTASDVGISAGEVRAATGSQDIFRLRYGWFSTPLNNFNSFPSSGCTESRHLERISPSNVENPSGPTHATEVKNKDTNAFNVNEVTNVAVELTDVAGSHLVVDNQTEVKNEDLHPSGTSKLENNTTVEEKSSNEQFKYEDSSKHNESSFTALLWSDLSNISIGGLLSEASLQGRFANQDSKQGGKPTYPPGVSDSLDAFINQITCPQAPNTLTPNTPLSILDAEDTCHSFAAVLKPSPSSGKDFLTLGRRAFSELSNQSVAPSPRPFKCPKFEANAQEVTTVKQSVDEEPKADPLPCSGIFNNENSLGLSTIGWNDSLGPFDPILQMGSRQIINDDSISIGGFVR